jgi:hypothetical protein
MWTDQAVSLPIVPPKEGGIGMFALFYRKARGRRMLGAARLALPEH